MKDHREHAERWLDRENRTCQQDRVHRLVWLASVLPQAEYYTFPGGWMAKHLYEEARYSFVYAQFLAAIVLGFAGAIVGVLPILGLVVFVAGVAARIDLRRRERAAALA